MMFTNYAIRKISLLRRGNEYILVRELKFEKYKELYEDWDIINYKDVIFNFIIEPEYTYQTRRLRVRATVYKYRKQITTQPINLQELFPYNTLTLESYVDDYLYLY